MNSERITKNLRKIVFNNLHIGLKNNYIENILDENGKITVGYNIFRNLLKKMYPNLRKAKN